MLEALHAQERFEQRLFADGDVRKTSLEAKRFCGCTFERCNFGEARLSCCYFERCAFIECDLSMVQVAGSSFVEARFERCKAIGINWTTINNRLRSLEVVFKRSTLNYSSFVGLDLRRVAFSHCSLTEVNFGEADLSDVTFDHVDLNGSDFLHTNLSRTDFRTAKNYAINLNDNIVKATRFSFPEAISLLEAFDVVIDFGNEDQSHTER